MKRKDSSRQLSDAADLLYMLEQLMDGLVRSSQMRPSQGAEGIPWAGIQLTLSQARDLILDVNREQLRQSAPNSTTNASPRFDRDLGLPGNFSDNDQSGPLALSAPHSAPLSASLADRIQPSPSGGGSNVGRIRELMTGGTSTGRGHI